MSAGKFDYYCVACDKTLVSFANWRTHIQVHHGGKDPRYGDITDALHRIDRGPEVGGMVSCTWAGCDAEFRDADAFYSHVVYAHKVQKPKVDEKSNVRDLLAHDFLEYLAAEDLMDDEDRKAGR